MHSTFFVTPLNKNALVNEKIFKKGKHTFSVISTYSKCVLIANNIPKSKQVKGLKYTIFKNFDFKEGGSNYKRKLILPDDLDEEESKLLKQLFKSDYIYSWRLKEHGWKSFKETYLLIGEFESIEVPVHRLTLFSSEQELQIMFLSKEQVHEICKNGLPQSLIDELSGESEVSAPVFDERTTLTIDDKEVPDFYKKFKIKYDNARKRKIIFDSSKNIDITSSEHKFALIGENYIKRSWYQLTIYEDFDFSNLDINISRESIFGSDSYLETFSLNYGDLTFEFLENYGVSSSEIYIIDSNGKRITFKIVDDEEEDENEE